MQKIRITNILLCGDPESFSTPFRMEIFLESDGPLLNKLEWKVVYVGSAESSAFDQILDDIMVPIEFVGAQSFELAIEPPDPALIPSINDLLGPSVLMIAALYNDQEFFRASYFVYNNYIEEVVGGLNENNFDINKVFRCVLTKTPRIRLNEIDWNDEQNAQLANMINLGKLDDLEKMREETLSKFDQYKDPFGFNENSFLGTKFFNDNGNN